jgi:hypothetical protein
MGEIVKESGYRCIGISGNRVIARDRGTGDLKTNPKLFTAETADSAEMWNVTVAKAYSQDKHTCMLVPT